MADEPVVFVSTGRSMRERVPVAPLVRAIDAAAPRLGGEKAVMRDARLDLAVLRRWRAGEGKEATWEQADRVMLALGLLWWEVFDPADPANAAAVEAWGDDE